MLKKNKKFEEVISHLKETGKIRNYENDMDMARLIRLRDCLDHYIYRLENIIETDAYDESQIMLLQDELYTKGIFAALKFFPERTLKYIKRRTCAEGKLHY
jgi:hypothetical protein